MRILDRYVARQLFPAWLWCLVIFVFLSCLVDLFGRLDEILRYHVKLATVAHYYINFVPLVFVKASPLALLLGVSFVAMRLSRHQEFLAMSASGTSLLRASVPFLFIGWLASLSVFAVSERLLPQAAQTYEMLQQEVFRDPGQVQQIDNVAALDAFNRLYHARTLNVDQGELYDLTILEHDLRSNTPTKTLYAQRAIYTKHGWLLLYGRIYRTGPDGLILGDPEPFVERLLVYPVTPRSFSQPQMNPETMRYGQLRLLIMRLKQTGITNVRRLQVELASKLSLPLMNVLICLVGFVGSTRQQLRGNLKGLGLSLGLGVGYYLGVATCQAMAKEWPLPLLLSVWLPHAVTLWLCLRELQTRR